MSSNGLSAQEMISLYRGMQSGNVNEEQVERLWNQVDEETKQQALAAFLHNYVHPHLYGVRDRADESPGNEAIREQYAALPEDEQQEIFDEAVTEVVSALFELRDDPQEGIFAVKGLLRDPFVLEGLLLIFENDDHIDAEYAASMKDFAARQVQWMGVALFPEMYPPETVRHVYDELGIEYDDDAVDAEVR